jgi:hypothetical protein
MTAHLSVTQAIHVTFEDTSFGVARAAARLRFGRLRSGLFRPDLARFFNTSKESAGRVTRPTANPSSGVAEPRGLI